MEGKAILCRSNNDNLMPLVEVSFKGKGAFPIIIWQQCHFISTGDVDDSGRYIYRLGSIEEVTFKPDPLDVIPINSGPDGN